MIAREELDRGASKARSVIDVFQNTVARRGAQIAGKQKRDGRWVDTTWAEMGRRVRDVSDGLASMGIVKGDRVSIIGETTLEWNLADLGIMATGAVTVPIYQSNRPAECQYILDNAGVKYIFCDTDVQIAKIREVRAQLPALKGIIRLFGSAQDPFETTLADVEKAGVAWRASNPNSYAERLASLTLDDAASFIYTSGTTGNPKGVVLTHGNWVYEAQACAEINILNPDDVSLSFLPMAHSFAKVNQTAWLQVGCMSACVESIDKIIQNAGEVKPTVMPSVPRIFEKAYNAVVSKGLAAPGLKGKLFKLAMEGLEDFVDAKERGRTGGGWKLLIGQKLIFPKIGAAMTQLFGGRMRLFISGGAPLSPKIAWFFKMVGFEVCEGYGLTETSAGTFVNRIGKVKIGTVGPPMPGTQVKIAPDGEVLIKGPGVMKEYYRNPEATAEVLKDGWLYTGDIGELDSENYLKITDRKKDIIVTAGGKNVAPQNLENELKTEPLISQVMVHGDKRKFLSALITLNEENVGKWVQENGVKLSGPAHEDPRVRARLQQAVDTLNAKQASYSQIKKFAILPKDFTQDSGELTPTLKVKRKFASQKYKDILDAFYVE